MKKSQSRTQGHPVTQALLDCTHCLIAVIGKDLELAYQQMAQEEERETEALEWAETTIGDALSRRN